ncbi:hypothetical protein BDW22DRAFT_1426228 [Trametopsis cervina]|nr:hypothetical protein BDW22DRAFT_1426228 [Trametopsis cervina]
MASSEQALLGVLVGPLLVFICIALMLFGILTAQCYFYWTTYVRDPTRVRVFVLALWLLESLHTAFCIHIVYFYFITNFGNPQDGIFHIVWSCAVTVFVELLIVAMTEGFYIHRIYCLSHSLIVASVPAVLLVSRVIFGFVSAAYLYVYDTWAEFHLQKIPQALLTTSLSLGVATDLAVTALLIYCLNRERTHFVRTDSILAKLMRHVINNGALSMVLSLIIIIVLHTTPNSLVFAGLIETISKLYANSMMASLNARQSLSQTQSQIDTSNAMELSFHQDAQRRPTRLFMHSSHEHQDVKPPTEIKIQKNVYSV